MAAEKIGNAALDILKKESYMGVDQLKRLSEHRYKADDKSFLTRVFYRYFWDWVTQFYPLWLAPNLITFSGLVINSVATLILASYSPDCAHFAPKWAYLQCALALFIYQTLDSTDGKQARRTNSSSPLGELFDHGCDAMTQASKSKVHQFKGSEVILFLAIQVSLTLSLGDTEWGVLKFWIGAVYMFYAAHWQTYSTGVLKFGEFDIVESQCVIMAILLLSGTVGPDIWFAEVFGITLRRLVLTPVMFIAVYVSSVVLYTIYTQGAGKGGRTVADTSLNLPIVPTLSFLLPPILIYWKSTTGIYDRHAVLFCLAFGMPFVKYTCQIILAHMSRSPINVYDTILLGPLIIGLNQYFGAIVSEYYLLYICLIYGFANLAYYAYAICHQICDYLKIDCFCIPYPPPPKAESEMNGSIASGDRPYSRH